MLTTKCENCGEPAVITEKDKDAGTPVYCSEACALPAKTVKVGEFRDLTRAVRQVITSVKSCATDKERSGDLNWLRRVTRELYAADCKRATTRDREARSANLREAFALLDS